MFIGTKKDTIVKFGKGGIFGVPLGLALRDIKCLSIFSTDFRHFHASISTHYTAMESSLLFFFLSFTTSLFLLLPFSSSQIMQGIYLSHYFFFFFNILLFLFRSLKCPKLNEKNLISKNSLSCFIEIPQL